MAIDRFNSFNSIAKRIESQTTRVEQLRDMLFHAENELKNSLLSLEEARLRDPETPMVQFVGRFCEIGNKTIRSISMMKRAFDECIPGQYDFRNSTRNRTPPNHIMIIENMEAAAIAKMYGLLSGASPIAIHEHRAATLRRVRKFPWEITND